MSTPFFAASMRAMRVRTCSNSWVDALSGAKRYPLSPKAHGSTILARAPRPSKLFLAQFIEYVELFLGNRVGTAWAGRDSKRGAEALSARDSGCLDCLGGLALPAFGPRGLLALWRTRR